MLDVLVLLFTFVFFTWYIQFHWRRQALYKEAAKIKGPAGWPVIGNVLVFARNAAHVMEYLTKLSTIYPNMTKLWLGPELVISVYNPEALDVILNSPKALAKKDFFYKFLVPIIGFGLVTGPVSRWKRHRKTISPSFNQQILNGFMDTFSDQCTILVDQLRKFANKGEFDIIVPISKCTVDATCGCFQDISETIEDDQVSFADQSCAILCLFCSETIMGVKIDQQRSDSNFQFIVHRVSEIIAERITVIFYQLDFIFHQTKLAKEFTDLNKQFNDFTGKVIKEKQQILKNQTEDITEMEERGSKRKTFLELLLKNSNFTEEELKEEVNTFMLGSSDTVSLAAGFILLMLGMHNDIQDKVLEEVLTVVGPDRQVELADLPQMKYTERVIKETLRLFPGFPFIARSLEDDIPFKDELTFPKGSSIIVSILSMHRMDKYWPDPLKFNPDRFLPEAAAERHPYCFLPFSAGARNCIGFTYGFMILKTMIASVIRSYKVSTKFKKVEDVELKYEVTLGSKHGFPISLETR